MPTKASISKIKKKLKGKPTQTEAAKQSGLSQAYISKLLNGLIKKPSQKALAALEKIKF